MNSQEDIAQQLSPQLSGETLTWRPLRHFSYYRFTLALSLILFFYNTGQDGFLGSSNPDAFLAAVSLFFISSLVYIFLTLKQAPSFGSQVIISNSTDILLITLMMHYSGGLGSGLGMLLIINIAATGTFLQSRMAYLFASFATISVLAEQTNSLFSGVSSTSSYSTAGILGMGFLAPRLIFSNSAVGAHGAFWGYCALWGLGIAPMVGHYMGVDPGMVVQAFGIAAATFGATSLFGYVTKRSLSGLGTFFMIATIGIIIAMVVNAVFIGSIGFSLVVSIITVLLFAGITAYETQMIKEMYVEGDGSVTARGKSIFGAFMLYGSFITMFIHILNILGIMNSD